VDHGSYKFEDRAREKQASRDEDARALASGEKDSERLWRENSALPASAAHARIDFSRVGSVRG
jgi:hypothetical protein